MAEYRNPLQISASMKLDQDTRIWTEPDTQVEPGHQWILISNTPSGKALAQLLRPDGRLAELKVSTSPDIRIPHDEIVAARLNRIVDLCAHLQFVAPGWMQLSLLTDG